MKRYTVYFEVFGKKLKMKVKAYNLDDAKEPVRKVANRINFLKLEEDNEQNPKQDEDDSFGFSKDMFGIK